MKDSFVVITVIISSVAELTEATEFLNLCCYHIQAMSLKAHNIFVSHLNPWCVVALL